MTDFDILKKLLEADRSVRRFQEEKIISYETLEELVSLVRFCASGRNLQPLRYRIVDSAEELDRVFPLLSWAGYLSDWDGPARGERPVAYLVQCLDTRLTKNCLCDDGLQLQAITLGASARGLGACIIKSFNKEALAEALSLTDIFVPLYVLALGYPKEKVIIEDIDTIDDSIKYYRTPDGVHHVPKRVVRDLIINRPDYLLD